MSKKIFVICPVRDAPPELNARIKDYITELEALGHHVHWPTRDTNQNDPEGMRICRQNGFAIYDADEVHIWFSPTSTGTLFDIGMFFMASEILGLQKRLVIINKDEVPATNGKKSFNNVLRALADRVPKDIPA